MATCDPSPSKYEDAEATGRKVYGVYGSTKTGPNVEFGKLMWKNISRLLEEGSIKVCIELSVFQTNHVSNSSTPAQSY